VIQAIVWDMDGVLIDSEPLWRQAEVEVLSSLGVPITMPDTIETMGRRIDDVIRLWFNRSPWEGPSIDVVAQNVVERVIELVNETGEVKPGVYEAFALLRSCNMRMALASSSSSVLISAVLQKLELNDFLEFAHSAEHEEFGKPHPAVYLTAARKLGLAPQECLAFEDSGAGVEAAKNAGMKCLCIPDPAIDSNKIQRADLILPSLTELRKEHLDMLMCQAKPR